MKKLILMAALFAMPFVFSSCDPDEPNPVAELTGSVSMTVGGQQINLPAAAFTKQNGRVILTSTNLNHSIAMYIDATATGTYTLGAAESVTGLITHLSEITNILSGDGNYLLYSPSNNVEENAKIVLVGTVTFSEFSSNKVAGYFSGMAVSKGAIVNLELMDIVDMFIGGGSNITQIAGTFTAVGK